MDVMENLVELIGSTEYGNGSLVGNNFQKGFVEKIASHLIDHGVTVQEWIPVTERLPGKYETVVGWCKDNPFSAYREEIVCWNGKGWVFLYAQRYVTSVTHWMPLPEPPKGE